MTLRHVFAATIALVAAGIATPSASAACNPPKFASTYNPATGASVYWTTTVGYFNSFTVGRIWSNGTDYTGTCNDGAQTFFSRKTIYGDVALSLSLGNACIGPGPGVCPSGNLNARVWVMGCCDLNDLNQETYARQVPETPSNGVNFDFSDLAVALAPSPRPRVISASRVGSNVNITTMPATIPGDAGSLSTMTACKILSAVPSPYPKWFAADYPTVAATVPASNGTCPSASFTVDCSVGGARWLVYQVVTDAGPDAIVGPPTLVNCDPALAEPKAKINPKMTPVSVRD